MREFRAINGAAPIDFDKVAALRDRIAAGDYRIDPRAIAERMIEVDLSPIGPTRR